jgi:hypothetical protein
MVRAGTISWIIKNTGKQIAVKIATRKKKGVGQSTTVAHVADIIK